MERVLLEISAHLGRYARLPWVQAMVSWTDDIADITQEILAALWIRWSNDPDSFEAPANPRAFAERLIRNHLVDHLEAHKRREKVFPDDRTLDELHDSEHAGPMDPHADALARERQAIVDHALGELPTKRREACRLWWSGLGYASIAERLGISESTARSHVHNGNQIINETLASYRKEGT